MCKGLLIDDVGVSRGTVFQEIRPVAGFETVKPVISLKKSKGGYYRRTTLTGLLEISSLVKVWSPSSENKKERTVHLS